MDLGKVGAKPAKAKRVEATAATTATVAIATAETTVDQAEGIPEPEPQVEFVEQASSGWVSTKSDQAACESKWTCDACMVKNSTAAKICVCCETPQPGCEEEAKAAKEAAFAAKEAEMKATMAAAAKTVAAAGISFGLPAGATASKLSFGPRDTTGLAAATEPQQEKTQGAPTAHGGEQESTEAAPAVLDRVSAEDAVAWLSTLRLEAVGLADATAAFTEHQISGAILCAASIASLKTSFGIEAWGVRAKIAKAVRLFKETTREMTEKTETVAAVEEVRQPASTEVSASPGKGVRAHRPALGVIGANTRAVST